MNNELMKALKQFYNRHPDLIRKNLSNEEEINQFINSMSPEQIFKIIIASNDGDDYCLPKQIEPMKAIATTPDNRNDIPRTPYGDIPTMITDSGYYNQLYERESPIPKNKKEINIRRESLVSIFKNRAELLLNTFFTKQINLFIKELKIEAEYCGGLGFVVHYATSKMKFLKSLDFYFEYNLTDSMLCDLTNQACSYVYNQLMENKNYNLSEISSDTILQITNCYGKIFWGTLIQLNREAHDYYYNMGIPDFQEPKKLN